MEAKTLNPVYKIEVYDSTPALRYTIEKHAFNIRTEKVLTSNIGTFSFSLPSKIGTTTKYSDIVLGDSVKIYFGYGSVSVSPYFVGKIYQIHGVQTKDGGITRVIKGRDQGEVLLRRYHGMDDWEAEEADDIATEIANDLSLGTGDIDNTETTEETHRIDIDKHKRYFDFLQEVSDYWKDAGTQVKQDFHVDADNDLVWDGRPFRSTGVETLTVGTNIRSYGVVRDLTEIKNRIWVYGKRGKPNDSSLDMGTDMATPEPGDTTVDALSASGQKVLNVTATADFTADDTVIIYNWGNRWERNTIDTIQAGVSLTMDNNLENSYQIGDLVYQVEGWTPPFANVTLAAVNGAGEYQVGDRAIEATAVAASDNGMTYFPTANLNLNHYPRLNFMAMSATDQDPQLYVRLDDTSFNQAWYYLPSLDKLDIWKSYQISVGRDHENGWAIWDVDPGFDWANVWAVSFVHDDVNNGEFIVDGFYLDNRRHTIDDTYYGYTQNDASITSYGIHEMIVVDENLASDADCLRRGEALLYQLKDPIVRVDIEAKGNSNILLGDRLSLTIPAEGISAASYDVTKVSQIFNNSSWSTLITAVNTSSSRKYPPRSNAEYLNQQFSDQRTIGGGVNLQK